MTVWSHIKPITLARVRDKLEVPATGGRLCGWVQGEGRPVLLLHGGPGLGYEYLDDVAADIGDGFRVAAFQQRGLTPSTIEGPFTMAQAIADVITVADGLGWDRFTLVGHSWGAHLALRVIAAHPDRLTAALVIEPIGVVGDGGVAAFAAELTARTPRAAQERLAELDEREEAGTGTAEEALEGLSLLLPAYFADPERVFEMPEPRLSLEAYSGLSAGMADGGRRGCRAHRTGAGSFSRHRGRGQPGPVGAGRPGQRGALAAGDAARPGGRRPLSVVRDTRLYLRRSGDPPGLTPALIASGSARRRSTPRSPRPSAGVGTSKPSNTGPDPPAAARSSSGASSRGASMKISEMRMRSVGESSWRRRSVIASAITRRASAWLSAVTIKHALVGHPVSSCS